MNEARIILAMLKINRFGPTEVLKYIKKNDFSYKLTLEEMREHLGVEKFELLLKKADCEIKLNNECGIQIISLFEKKFPKRLYTTTDPILYLYYKGDIDLINKKNIAIIGTRKASNDGLKLAYEAGTKFAENEIVVTSGLALGIDAASHEGSSFFEGKSLAVLPSDLHNIKPSANSILADTILKKGGCLVSEYSIETSIKKYNFVRRDRIQSALSHAVLVIEADEKSGTMNAVNKSLKEGKPVFQLKTNSIYKITKKIDLYNETDFLEIINSINKEYLNTNKKTNQLSLF